MKGSADRKAAKQQANQQYANDMATAKLQREWNIQDRDETRAFNAKEEAEARAYDRAQLNESRTYSRQVLGHLVEDAQKAGFNPLSVLRSGGGSNYNAGAGFAPLSATPTTETPMFRVAPNKRAVNAGSPIADGIASAADTFLKFYDPYADERREESYRIIASQVASQNAGALSGARAGYGSGSRAAGSSAKTAALSGSALANPVAPEQNIPKVTNPWDKGLVDPTQRDASSYEDRYGELGGSILGGYVFMRDAVYSAQNNPESGWNRIKGAFNGKPKLPPLRVPPSMPRYVPGKRSTGGGGGW